MPIGTYLKIYCLKMMKNQSREFKKPHQRNNLKINH